MGSTEQLRIFLEHNVEKYLFGDLERMTNLAAIPASLGGGVGYPMLQSAFAGIELLGGLLSEDEFSTSSKAGRKYFVEFWQQYLYETDSIRMGLADAVYTLFRNGIAHTFLPKGQVGVTLGHYPWHLRRDSDGVVFIDAHVLARDLRSAYERHLRPILDQPGHVRHAGVLLRLKEMGDKYAESAMSVEITSFPLFAVRQDPNAGPTGPRGAG